MSNQSFLFLTGHPTTSHERKLSERKARSHTAKVNTRKRLGTPLHGSTDSTARGGPSPTPKFLSKCAIMTPDSEGQSTDDDYVRSSSSRHRLEEPTSEVTRSTPTPEVPPLRWTVSPMLGAQSTNTFALASSRSDLEKATDYCRSTITREHSHNPLT